MKTGDLAKLFGVSDTTIRSWVREFSDFFSKSHTKQRTYTDEDVQVLATVAKYSHAGYQLSHIRERLEAGERVENPGEVSYGVDTRLVPAAAMEQMIDATELRIELEQIKSERDRLVELLDKSEEQKESLRREVKDLQEEMRQEVKRLQGEISNLQRELGRAEARAEIYKEDLDRRKEED